MPVSMNTPAFGSHFRVTIKSKQPQLISRDSISQDWHNPGTLSKNREFQEFVSTAFSEKTGDTWTVDMSPFPPVESNVGWHLSALALPERTEVICPDTLDDFAEEKIEDFIKREQTKPENREIQYGYKKMPDSSVPDSDTLEQIRAQTIQEAEAEDAIRETMRCHGLTAAQVIAFLKDDE
jgi:hypothetical protein